MGRVFFIEFLLLILTLGFYPFEEKGLWAAELPKAEMQNYLKQGIDKVFDMDEKGGIAELKKIPEIFRESPMGYAYLALAHLFFYEMSFDEKERERNQESMLHYVDKTSAQGEKRIEKDPRDGDAFFAMALAKLAKIRWLITRKRYFALTQETQNMWNYLQTTRELEPENYDVYFAMGLLRYHIDHLPAFTRFLSSLLIASGDRGKGLQELELAAKKGYLLKDLAKAELLSAYVNFENEPSRALPIAQDLRERFPRNYNILFGLANVYSELGRAEEALSVAREIESRIQSGAPPYRPELWPRYFQLMGRIHFDQGQYAQASEYFQRVLQDKSPYHARVRAWALVRLGMIHDVRQERNKAEEYYRKALEVAGGEGTAQIAAKQYLKVPYSPPNRK
ncbi:MAG: tetratricopeptide repeat protein [Deltaproteobacteria bacterium]|nr:tetratricopeptide repeat protein [Deltaproteobacteria bacterium]